MKSRHTLKSEWGLLPFILALCAFLAGCGGGNFASTPPPPPVAVTLDPSVVNVDQGGTQSFTATVTGASNPSVTWTVKESGGGSITADGVYTAPNSAGTYHVVATSVQDSTRSATCTVTVPQVAVTIGPSSVSLPVNTSMEFLATVSGTVNHNVSWSVQEGSGGTITDDYGLGQYTAPPATGTYHVVATSAADSTKSATATVTVTPPVVSVSPQSEILGPEGTRQYSAFIYGMTDQSVTWSVTEGPAGGSVDASGLYTAPSAQGTYHLTVTSTVDSSIIGNATVTVGAHGFKPVMPLLEARADPTATVLMDGRVLVAGGCDAPCDTYGNGILASAELFDPATNSFSAAGSMSDARLGHTATRLLDGRVLLVGGFDTTGYATTSVDLYDPNNETFTPTGNLITARAWHTATLLSDGRVLITGGITGFGDQDQDVLVTAEIYDPNSGTFSAAGNLSTGRWEHTATALEDGTGRVLIVGGFVDANGLATSTAEIFDSATGQFSPTGSMIDARSAFTSTLAGSTLLVAGGVDITEVFGVPGEILYSTTETYLPSFSKFLTDGPMDEGRFLHSAVALPTAPSEDAQVLVVGGVGYLVGALATAEVGDVDCVMCSMWEPTGSLQYGVDSQAAVVLSDGRVLVVGGFNADGAPVNLAEVYQ